MSRPRPRKEPVPPERRETVRQGIRAFLEGPPASAREISAAVRLPEKEVVAHLEHLARSLPHQGEELVVTPAECAKCGFVFRKRGRLRRPSHCPVCRGESIHDPLFCVREGGRRASGE